MPLLKNILSFGYIVLNVKVMRHQLKCEDSDKWCDRINLEGDSHCLNQYTNSVLVWGDYGTPREDS
jgi:hypothetical protein